MSNSSGYRLGVRVDGNADGLKRAAQEGQAALKMLGTGAQNSAKNADAAFKALGARGMTEFKRMAQAREVLGVRSEREVQREIARTEAAYGRLARAGTMSWHEQVMATRKMREEVTKLHNEMGRMTGRQKLMTGMKGVAAVGAGVGATVAVMAPKAAQAMEYEMRLANLANTAYAEQDVTGRKAGMGGLNDMIVQAVRQGGGTRDSAVTTAENLFGAGIFKPGEVRSILGEAVRAGTANNAEPTAFAEMAIKANQTMGIAADKMGRMFGMGTYAGQQGGFEIRDMAKWLPQQMGAAKAVGMYGEAGFAKLAALNQAAVVTAGTRDEAGNNVVNLLAKLATRDTEEHFQKQGVNLPKALAEGKMKGLDALDVLGNLLQQQLGKDKNYQAVQKQLAVSKNDQERSAALASVGDIAQGTVIGKVFQDRQALMALYGYMNGRDRVNSIAKGAMVNTDASDRNFALVSSMPGYQAGQRRNEQEIAMQTSMDKLTPTIGYLNEKVTGLMREYPGYTTAVIGATTALVALAGSAAAAALINGGKLSGLAALPGAAGALGFAKMAGGVGLAALGGYGVGTLAYKGLLEGNAGGDFIGRGIASTASFFGNKNADEALRLEGAYQQQLTQQQRLQGMRPQGLAERLGTTGTSSLVPQQDLRGEILVRVTGAPGLSVQAETRTNSPRIPMRADVGRTMMGSGQ